MTDQYIGVFMIALLFLGLFVLMARMESVKVAAAIFGVVIGLLAWVMLAVRLAVGHW